MTVLAIIQARMGSSRLPGKVLMDIAGKPMLQHVIERAQAIRGITEVVVAIPHTTGDAPLWEWLTTTTLAEPFMFFCTDYISPDDVLGRFWHAVADESVDTVMRLTGDCPLLDPAHCEAVLALWRAWPEAYCSNVFPRRAVPDGLDCEVFSMGWLQRAHENAVDQSDREHVTPWIRERAPLVAVRYYPEAECDLLCQYTDGALWSVDAPDDLTRVRRIMERLGPGAYALADTLQAAQDAQEKEHA